jgi:hypothetical protein
MTVEPHKKQLHISLAYQFPTDKKEKLEQLAKAINLKAPARWDLRLYSRDAQKARGSFQVMSFMLICVVTLPCFESGDCLFWLGPFFSLDWHFGSSKTM